MDRSAADGRSRERRSDQSSRGDVPEAEVSVLLAVTSRVPSGSKSTEVTLPPWPTIGCPSCSPRGDVPENDLSGAVADGEELPVRREPNGKVSGRAAGQGGAASSSRNVPDARSAVQADRGQQLSVRAEIDLLGASMSRGKIGRRLPCPDVVDNRCPVLADRHRVAVWADGDRAAPPEGSSRSSWFSCSKERRAGCRLQRPVGRPG